MQLFQDDLIPALFEAEVAVDLEEVILVLEQRLLDESARITWPLRLDMWDDVSSDLGRPLGEVQAEAALVLRSLLQAEPDDDTLGTLRLPEEVLYSVLSLRVPVARYRHEDCGVAASRRP